MLSAEWKCPHVDTDDVIVKKAGCSIGDFIREKGEPAFRELEFEALEEALTSEGVVSTGGGIVTFEKSRTALKAAPTVWLDTKDEQITPRLGGTDRPLLDGNPGQILKLMREARAPFYEEVSRARVDASGTLEDVKNQILIVAGSLA
jgi:shikimate kinase